MEKELALYIDDLESGWKQTNRAEDRKQYEAYLAHAACILSKVILQAPENELFEAIDTNEKLWGNSWLQGDWMRKNPNSYKEFKRLARYPGYSNT
jgi:hypothetical protein